MPAREPPQESLRFASNHGLPPPCASVTLQLQLRSAAGRFSVRERAGMKSAKKAGASTHPLSCSKMRQGQGTAHASRGSHPFNPPAAARQLRKSALRLRLQALMLRLQAKASCIILPPAREELAAFRRCSASLHAAPLRDPLRIPERAARAAFLRACACSLRQAQRLCKGRAAVAGSSLHGAVHPRGCLPGSAKAALRSVPFCSVPLRCTLRHCTALRPVIAPLAAKRSTAMAPGSLSACCLPAFAPEQFSALLFLRACACS